MKSSTIFFNNIFRYVLSKSTTEYRNIVWLVFSEQIREWARGDAIANLPTSQTIFLTSLRRPCACEATCSDSDEPSCSDPVVLQLVKRFPRHRIRSAILDWGERGARFVSLYKTILDVSRVSGLLPHGKDWQIFFLNIRN